MREGVDQAQRAGTEEARSRDDGQGRRQDERRIAKAAHELGIVAGAEDIEDRMSVPGPRRRLVIDGGEKAQARSRERARELRRCCRRRKRR